MKAKNITGKSPGGKRTKLADILPLKTPFIVQIFPIYACNYKCNYCIFSVKKKDRHFISNKTSMEFDLFKKAIDEMKQFPDKIKTLRFVGIGEPTMHKQIDKMVKYSIDKDIANVVEIITNGSLLTHELSNKLIEAKIDRVVISIQGIDAKSYKDIADVNEDFDMLVKNIKYFYENKKNTHIYIKIASQTLKDKNDEKKFFDIFGNICDTIAIENLVPIHEVKYNNEISTIDKTQFGQPLEKIQICPQPFFTVQLNPDGNIVPCHSFKYPEILGNVYNENFFDIWNGDKFNKFRYNMLTSGADKLNEICKQCTIFKYRIFKEDILDYDKDRLKGLFNQN